MQTRKVKEVSPHIADGYSVHDTPILETIEKQNDVFRSISYGIDENTICKVGNNALYFSVIASLDK